MQIQKLGKEERQKTRELWEKIFTEDTGKFLDYYYTVRTEGNEIYAGIEDGRICSMLHLNPYPIQVNGSRYPSDYIVAVATDASYRKRGFMAALLTEAMREMSGRGEPFTFLMPAAERIYLPFDFRYIYRQGQSQIKGRNVETTGYEMREAAECDCEELAAFAGEILEKRYSVYAARTEDYYRTALAEQKSENGGIFLVKKDGALVGMFFFAREGKYEIREPLFLAAEQDILPAAIYRLTGEASEVLCAGYGEESDRPMIMARILSLRSFLEALRPSRPFAFEMQVQDRIIRENQGRFRVESDGRTISVTRMEQCGDNSLNAGEICGEISIAALTSALFGYASREEIERKESEKIEDALWENLGNIIPVSDCFFNEIV